MALKEKKVYYSYQTNERLVKVVNGSEKEVAKVPPFWYWYYDPYDDSLDWVSLGSWLNTTYIISFGQNLWYNLTNRI